MEIICARNLILGEICAVRRRDVIDERPAVKLTTRFGFEGGHIVRKQNGISVNRERRTLQRAGFVANDNDVGCIVQVDESELCLIREDANGLYYDFIACGSPVARAEVASGRGCSNEREVASVPVDGVKLVVVTV